MVFQGFVGMTTARGAASGVSRVWIACLALALAAAIPGVASARGVPASFADLADKVTPSVVYIQTFPESSFGGANRNGGGNPFEREFEGTPFMEMFRDHMRRLDGNNQQPNALGSGFVIDPRGYIATNNHVIDSGGRIEVFFDDGKRRMAKVIGRDRDTDLAVLKVEAEKPLPALKFGNSDSARIGEWVLAAGNPFGVGNTVTAGIISARNRNIHATDYDDFIQTDAAINRGNSGGPLLNLQGEVIGINTAIISPSGGSAGVAFAIPSAIAENVVNQIIKNGVVRRGWLGVRIQAPTDEIAESLGLSPSRGALVADVTKGSPAAKVGIKPLDVILSFDDKPVKTWRELPRIVGVTRIGKVVNVEVWRDRQVRKFRLKVGLLPENPRISQVEEEEPKQPREEKFLVGDLGLSLAELNPQLRNTFGIEPNIDGVVVLEVEEGGAASGRLRRGDVIVAVDQKGVETPQDILSKVKKRTKDKDQKRVILLFHVRNQTGLAFVPVQVGKKDGKAKK